MPHLPNPTPTPSTAPTIRVLALGLIQQDDRLFVGEGYDPVKQGYFYRPLGGGLHFGETSLEALKREFWEELQAELTQIVYLGCLENLFVYNGKPGHELIQLYRCDFAAQEFYHQEAIAYQEDSGETCLARWVPLSGIQTGQFHLVPEGCQRYLNSEVD